MPMAVQAAEEETRAPDDDRNEAEKLYADTQQPTSDQTTQKNPQHRRAIIGAACAIAVLILGAAPITYSYLTASTDTVVNTFAGGAISIKLDEALVDTDGNPVGDTRVIENSYKITPGASYTKDPTITVLAGSEDAYIFIYVDNALPEEYFSLDYSSSWVSVATTGTKTLYAYQSVVTSSDEDVTLDPIFTTVTVSAEITSEQIEALGEVKLTIQSYAVQAEGVDQETAIEMAAAFFESEFGFIFDDVDTSIDISGVSSGSGYVAVAGQYSNYGTYWVPLILQAYDSTSTAEDKTNSFNLCLDCLGTGGWLTYSNLVSYVGTFNCGMVKEVTSDNTTGTVYTLASTYGIDVPGGVVMTVELRLYKDVSGSSSAGFTYGDTYITIATYKYTY